MNSGRVLTASIAPSSLRNHLSPICILKFMQPFVAVVTVAVFVLTRILASLNDERLTPSTSSRVVRSLLVEKGESRMTDPVIAKANA